MKFIHLADAHLDSPFRGLSFLPSAEFKRIQRAADQSFSRIVDLALKEQVDLVLIAGDTFDSEQPSPRSQLFLAQQIKRLTAAKIQVVMIFGNHDHMKPSDLLIAPSPYFKLLGPDEKIERCRFKTRTGFAYEVIGFSYLNNHISVDKIKDFPPKQNIYTFGLLHAQEKNSEAGKNVYAPFTLQELKDLNYDYFALGHIHHRQVLSTKPWIVYAGNIQGRHVNEQGMKGCYLGKIDENSGQTRIAFHGTSPIIWTTAKLQLDKELSKSSLQQKILACLKADQECHYYSLQIAGAQFLSSEENDLVTDSDFAQDISLSLPNHSQLVDVRLENSQPISLNNSDKTSFEQAKKAVFKPETWQDLIADWRKKDPVTARAAASPAFLKEVEELTELKLARSLKGIKDEAEKN